MAFFFLNAHDWFPLSALSLAVTKINLTWKMIEEWIERKRATEGYKEIGEALIHGRHVEKKAASLTDPESHIRVWWSWHVQECGRKDWGGDTEVWEWIMLCFSQKSKAPEQAGIGSQWSLAVWGNGSKINCVCLRLSPSVRPDSGRLCVQVCHFKINDQCLSVFLRSVFLSAIW